MAKKKSQKKSAIKGLPKIKQKRIVEVLKDGVYIKIAMKDLKKGDKFKLFEYDGTPVRDQNFVYEFEAACDAFLNENNKVTIEIV